MTERYPTDEDDWQRRMDAIERARAEVGAGYQLGSIAVKYDGPYAARGSVWVRADCSECRAVRVMSATNRIHLGLLALDLARIGCVEQGHVQDLAALQGQYREDFPYQEGDDG